MNYNKKAAFEMTMGTVVIVVLSVSLLIFGVILIRSIMCAGLTTSESISSGIQNEVKGLFSTDTYGVHCMGEGGQDINLATGGRRKIICFIKTEEQADYDLKVTDIKALNGASTETVKKWVINQDWSGSVSPGSEKEADVLLLDIPRDASTTTIRLTVESTNKDTAAHETITPTIYIVSTGFIKGSIC